MGELINVDFITGRRIGDVAAEERPVPLTSEDFINRAAEATVRAQLLFRQWLEAGGGLPIDAELIDAIRIQEAGDSLLSPDERVVAHADAWIEDGIISVAQ